ncbi:MAG: hypothetical protein AAF573_07505 [Bacteroidota bacterium]
MRKLLQFVVMAALFGLFLSSCREDTICLECRIIISGITDDKGKTCDDLDTINALEADYQEIVDRENLLVPQSATLICKKYIQP